MENNQKNNAPSNDTAPDKSKQEENNKKPEHLDNISAGTDPKSKSEENAITDKKEISRNEHSNQKVEDDGLTPQDNEEEEDQEDQEDQEELSSVTS